MSRLKASDRLLGRISSVALTKSNQSSLYRWMTLNHDAFSAALLGINRPGWNAIVEELQAAGLSKPNGDALTAAYARQVWWKVRKRHDLTGQITSRMRPVLQAGEVAVGVHRFVAASPAPQETRDAQPARRLRVATSLPGAPVPDAPSDPDKAALPTFQGARYPKPIL